MTDKEKLEKNIGMAVEQLYMNFEEETGLHICSISIGMEEDDTIGPREKLYHITGVKVGIEI